MVSANSADLFFVNRIKLKTKFREGVNIFMLINLKNSLWGLRNGGL